MTICTVSATPTEQKDSEENAASKRRVLNFIVFNFILPILKSNHRLEKYFNNTRSKNQVHINTAISEIKCRVENGNNEDKGTLNSVGIWRKVSEPHFNDVFALIYTSLETYKNDFKITSNIPLYNLTQLYFRHDPDDGSLMLFEQLIYELGVKMVINKQQDNNLDVMILNVTIDFLNKLENKLSSVSLNVIKYINSDDELKAKALLFNLSIITSKSFLLEKASRMDEYIATSNFRKNHGIISSPIKNIVKVQAVMDTIIMSHVLHDCKGLDEIKLDINNLIVKFIKNCSSDLIVSNHARIIKLSKHEDLFTTYLANNTFEKLSDFYWFKNYMSLALERHAVYDFFNVMAVSFIPASDIEDVLRKAEAAIKRKINRKNATKRKQLNVEIDDVLLTKLNNYCVKINKNKKEYEKKITKNDIVLDIISRAIS